MEGHCSTELTVNRYGHPIAGANVSFVDWLEKVTVQERRMDQGGRSPVRATGLERNLTNLTARPIEAYPWADLTVRPFRVGQVQKQRAKNQES